MKPLRIFVFSKPQSIPPKKTFVCVCVYGFCFNSVLFFFFVCGFNICPEILWCPSVQEMECNSLPPECRLGLVIGLLWIKYGRGKIIILQWRSPVNTTSRLMSPGITHVDIITLIRRDEKNTSPVWYSFLKVITSKLIIRKTEIKTIMRYDLLSVRVAIKEKTNDTYAGTEKREHLSTVGRNVKWYSQ